MAYPNITKMLLEDALKIFFPDVDYTFFSEPVKCKDHDFYANNKAGAAIHLRKVHKIYIARGDGKRRLYGSKDLLPGSSS